MQDTTPSCLSRLHNLLERVRRTVQSRKQTNSLASYRIGFEITQPSLLLGGTMQPHQLQALEWMVNLTCQNSNAILADDMGLGKTIQAISYLAYLKEEHGVTGKHLVLCPKSVCMNWIREVRKWFPSANVQLLLNTEAEREEILRKVVRPRKFDILVTTYEGAKNCLGVLSRISWEVLVVDEAHKIKNSQSQNFICISALQASFKLLLTGTPLSNNLRELWSLLNFIMPGLFNDESLFDDIQDSSDQLQGTDEEKLAYQCKIAATFHQIIEPFFKRRTKKNLELGLPQKIEKTLFVPLSALQLQCYRNFLKYGNVAGPCTFSSFNIMNPRKICLHPYLFESIRDMQEEENEGLNPTPQELGNRMIEASGKLKILDKLLHKLISEGHKVLIFSQFTMLLDILETYCMFRSYKFCRIDGDTSIDNRDRQMDAFNKSSEYPIFLLSTRAGGLGINLVSADTVIIYDIDWNPQNDIQAMDRAYRMGQTRTVHVYKLITEHTIEERMLEFQKYKLIWDELVIQKGGFVGKNKRKDDPFSNMNMNQLAMLGKGDIFKLEADESDQNIEVVLQMGEKKDRQQDEEIRRKLMENIDRSNFNPFQEEPETCEEMEKYQSDLVIRRNYEQQKREKAKFDRMFIVPPFKFYVKAHKIKELEFELYMEHKREDRNPKLIAKINEDLMEAKSKGLFEHWSEIEYGLFLQAHKTCLKSDYEAISTFIGTKTTAEVMEYSTNFLEKAPNNERFTGVLYQLNLNQAKLRKEMARIAKEDKRTSEEKSKEELKDVSMNSKSEKADSLKLKNEELKREKEEKKKEEAAKKKEEAAQRKKEEAAKKAEESKRLKQEAAKAKKEEELRLKEETKRLKEEEKKKKEEEKQQMLQERKRAKEKAEQERMARKEKRQAELKAKKAKEEENLRKRQQKEEEERMNREKLMKSMEDIREEFERKRIESQRRKIETANNAAWSKAEDAQTSCTDDKDSRDKLEIVTPRDNKIIV